MAGHWVLNIVSATSLLLLVVTGPASSETSVCRLVDCPNFRAIRYYEELGCVRSDGSSECCPTRFNCSSLLSLDKTKCHNDGKTYENGDVIETRDVCASCWCYVGREGVEAYTVCATPQCRGFYAPDGMESVCYSTFSLDQCCGTGLKCANDTKSPRNVTECVYKGKTYLEDQFIPEANSECKKCVCQDGYDGTLDGPWCRSVGCDYYVWHPLSTLQRCAPRFYGNDKCCASTFECPSDEDTVVRRSENSTANEGDRCSFGNHTLNIGDEIHVGTNGGIKCRCDVPPFVICS